MFFPSIELLGDDLDLRGARCVGSHLLSEGTLTIGTLITAIYLLQLVFQPLQELSDVYGQLQAAAAAMVKISIGAGRRARDRRPPRRAADAADRGAIDLDAVQLRLRRDRRPARHRHPRAGRAAASRWSARRAAASRRSPS